MNNDIDENTITIEAYHNWKKEKEESGIQLLKPAVFAFLNFLAENGQLVPKTVTNIDSQLWALFGDEYYSCYWESEKEIAHHTHKTYLDNGMYPIFRTLSKGTIGFSLILCCSEYWFYPMPYYG